MSAAFFLQTLTQVVQSTSLEAGILLHAELKVSVDDGHGHEDSSSGAKGAHHVSAEREETESGPAECGGGGDDALEFLVDRGIAVACEGHVLVLELLGDVAGSRAGDLDPSLGEDGAGSNDEGHVHDGVEGVAECVLEAVGG